MKKTLSRLLSGMPFLLLAYASPCLAASGTWSNASGGSWGNPQNWFGGIVASGSGSLANFSTLGLSSDVTVTLDGARTIGSLTFGDQSATKHGWILNPGAGGALTLSGTTPILTVQSATTTVHVAIHGSAGLTKAGVGKLELLGPNTYTGATAVNAGSLGLSTASFSATNPLDIAAGAIVESSGTLNLVVNSSGTAQAINGPGTVRLTAIANGPTAPDIYFGPNHSANSFWGARLSADLDLGGQQRFVHGKTGHNGVGVYGLTNADCQFAGSISGTGGMTLMGQNDWTGSGPMEVSFAFNASNTFTGPLEIRRGSLYLGHSGALRGGNRLTLNPAAGDNARLFLYGNSAEVSDLSSPGAGASIIANGNRKSGAGVNLGSVTLTVNQNNDGTFSGILTDAFPEYHVEGSGSTGALHLFKTGAGRLILNGTNDYSGDTTVSSGTLQVDGTLGSGLLTVRDGGSLEGNGRIAGPVLIHPGGRLLPGPEIKILKLGNSLILGGRVEMQIRKNGGTITNDRVQMTDSVVFGGTLLVQNIGSESFSAGDQVVLFTAGSFSNAFASFVLPQLLNGLAWDTSQLTVNGALLVIDPLNPPHISRHPQDLTVIEGTPATMTVVASGAQPITYQWQKNGSNINGANESSYAIASTTTNDSGEYRVVVHNPRGTTTSFAANLTVTLPPPPSPVTNGLVVHLSFDNTLDAQGNTTINGTLYRGTPRYSPGVIGSAAAFANASANAQPDDWAVSLGNLERLYSNNFTISFWQRNPGGRDGALMGNKNWASGANVGWVISTLDAKNVNWNVEGGSRRDLGLHPPFSDNNWHLATVTWNRASNQVLAYVDGTLALASDLNPNPNGSLNAGFSTLVGSSGNGLYSSTGDVDDLGVWNRVLSAEEIQAIYRFGLIGKPLNLALPGDAPEITIQPANQNLTAGSTTELKVEASGPGPLYYQWRFNGTNIHGATNATLVLDSISTPNQGVYSVLVYNEFGGALSAGAVLSLYELQVTGQWDFKGEDLRATVGEDLEYLADTESLTTFGLMNMDGTPTPVMGFGSNSFRQGYILRHGAKPNGGGQFVNQYSLLMDILYPGPSDNQWRALFQSDPFNHEGNDADFYVGNGSTQPEPNGLGIAEQFNGALIPDTWHRIAFVVDLAAPADRQLIKYLDGVEAGRQSLPGGLDGRFALGPSALLFTSGLSSASFTRPGYVSSIQFVNGCMSAQAIAALGKPSPEKLPPGNAALRLAGIQRQNNSMLLHWTGPSGHFQVEASPSLANPDWQPIGPLSTNRSYAFQSAGAAAFYRVTHHKPDILVGQLPYGEQGIPTKQILRAAGEQIQFAGRPVDLARSPDGQTIYIKNINSLLVVGARTWRILQTLNYQGSGASMHGIAVSPDGTRVYVTGSGNELYEWQAGTGGIVSFVRTIALPSDSNPCGIAISTDGNRAYVCLGKKNTLAVVNLATGALIQQINVGIAPWDVALSADDSTAFVSDWGGRFPKPGEPTAPSAGTPVLIDHRGVAASGVISIVNLTTGVEVAQVPAGLHPSDIELSPDGTLLFVANANSDTVTVIDTQSRSVRENILVRPDPGFPYGSAADGLAVSKDGKHLFVASAGNNAVAVIGLPNAQRTNSLMLGLLPTDWYPGAVVVDSNHLYVINVKGLGTRLGQPATTKWQIGAHLGTANKISIPDAEKLSKFTAQAHDLGRIEAIRTARLSARADQPRVPVPFRTGEPSVFKHVVYILKENKTYDQLFGDLPQGNGEPSLCIYPRLVSPNHHALAEQYVLLDNFYCSGVNSADGHSWSTEANVTDHLEKSFGGFVRSYTFGDDPLTYSSTGFIWNNVLEHGLTFRNYGEMDYASPSPEATWLQIYRDFTNGTRSIKYKQNIGIASLRPYSSTNVPGWNMGIPDIVRADGFIRDLNQAQERGTWENFHLLYLPNDHTGGPPTPRAQMADNDLALGQVVEAITKSIFASNTVIFVIEDDPQSGYDHVDGHRSICLVISPYTKRGKVISTFYNQQGVLHTMQRIMGLPPMNQQDAMAPILFECFTNTPDFTPYTALPNNINLAEGTSGTGSLTPTQRYWAEKARDLDLSAPDRIDEDTFNRYIWHSIKGDEPYPSEYAGAHGNGLAALGLTLTAEEEEEDEEREVEL